MKFIISLFAIIFTFSIYAQSWQDVGGGTNNSSHGMLVWDGKLVNLGSYNNPCQRVSTWDGATWECLGGGVGIVARAGCVWNGNLVVVGDFWNNFQPCVGCNGVAMWDGTSWTPFDQGFNNDVLTCTVYNGDLIIGGDFTEANGVPCSRVVRWNEITSTFESLGTQTSFGNDVRCMTEFEGDLWVGGDFNNVDGCTACDGVVKWDETTSTWEGGNSGVDLVGGVNESVRVLYVNPNDGNLYMGGEFPELIDGNAGVTDFNMSGIAMYDGTEWTPLGTGLNEYCRAIHEYNGKLIAGGYFTTAGGVSANKIAKWDPITSTWSAMGLGFDGVGIDEYVKSATVWNGIFFAGGAYTQAEGAPMNYIAQWFEPVVDPPVASINNSGTNGCAGVCIDFLDNSTNSPTTWSWMFPGSSTPSSTDQNPGSICFPSAGTFTVELQACNGFGCNTTTVDIIVEDLPTLTVNDEIVCDGGSATLTAVPSIGGGFYYWFPGGETTNSIIVSPGATTSYDVEYTLNGCTSALETSIVTVETTPTVSLSGATICSGDNITLTPIPSVGGGTYLWGGGETTSSITDAPGITTDYSVVYTLNGCSSSNQIATVNVNPVYNLTENVAVCNGANYTYPDGTSEIITGSISHTNNLISVSGCDSIIISNVSLAPTYNLSENVSVCDGTNYTYPDGTSEIITGSVSHTNILSSVSGCDSIIISNMSIAPTYSNTENVSVCEGTNYAYPDGTFEIISANVSHTNNLNSIYGCDSVVITNVTLISGYNTSENISICEGNDFTYPDGTTSINIIADEIHTSSLTSVDGCDSVITTAITVNPAPDNAVTESGNVITSVQVGANYQWVDCDNGNAIIPGQTSQSYAPTSNGNYAVEIDLNGCTSISTCVAITSLKVDEFQNCTLSIYPNPAENIMYVESTISLNDKIYQIYDAQGRVVIEGMFDENGQIVISDLTSGIYFLRVNGTVNIQFIKG